MIEALREALRPLRMRWFLGFAVLLTLAFGWPLGLLAVHAAESDVSGLRAPTWGLMESEENVEHKAFFRASVVEQAHDGRADGGLPDGVPARRRRHE